MMDDRRPPTTDGILPGATPHNRMPHARRIPSDTASGESLVRRPWLERLAKFFQIASIVVIFAGFIITLIGVPRAAQVVALAPAPIQTMIPTLLPLPTSTPTLTPTPAPPLVALLAGHSGGADTGAICPDGLREVDITVEVAQRAKTILVNRGYRVDILAEFDNRLDAAKRDYAPQVFLALHVDSCVYYASGYKVARADNSAIPVLDDRLAHCVSSAYGLATQLPIHEGSITRDMTHYHALNEIDQKVPGAIIELGFMGSDKAVLKNKRDAMATAIADGIDSFLRGNACQ